MIKLTLGSIFDKKCDLLVIPCSTSGSITEWVLSELKQHNIPLPLGPIPFGIVLFVDTRLSFKNALVIGFAASVEAKTSRSSSQAIFSIGSQLASYCNSNNLRQVNIPLLGTGAGGLSGEISFKSLFESLGGYETNTCFEIYTPDKDIYGRLQASYFQSREPDETITIKREIHAGRRDVQKGTLLSEPDLSTSKPVHKAEMILEPLAILETIFTRFHRVVIQLRSRRDSRPTIEVRDEYDVQDLLHALLRIYFYDIRSEEWTPSYAGSSNRMDFLLKNEGLVVEVKKTRDKLRDRDIGNELLIDIARYKSHPDCKTLVCFVYDPEGFISNPTGLENDLNKLSNSEFKVSVYISPKN
jgi:hypothetical protein